MSNLLGLLEQFDPAIHEWSVYYNRLQVFLAANEIGEERRVPVFLALLGHKAYSTVQDLCMPDLPTTKTLAQLKTIMDSHFGPKVNIRAARTSFRAITQREGQSVADFISALRHGAINCEFGAQLADNLLDQFVAGLHDKRIQSKLCQTDALNFQRACEQASLMETTEQEVRRMASNFASTSRPPPDTSTHAIAAEQTSSNKPTVRPRNGPRPQTQSRPQTGTSGSAVPRQSGYSCYRCGLANHSANECFYRDPKCNACGKIGHKALVCRQRNRANEKQSTQNRNRPAQAKEPVASALADCDEHVDDSPGRETPPALEHIGGGRQHLIPPIRVQVWMDDHEVGFDVDTGSPITVITERVWRGLLGSPRLLKSEITVHSYSGHPLKVLGSFQSLVAFKGRKEMLLVYVASGTGSCLFGRDALEKFDVDWSIHHVGSSSIEARLAEVLGRHRGLFKEELGLVTRVRASVRLDPAARPVFCKSRPVPLAMRSRIERELERHVQNNVARKVQHSDWAMPIVPVPKPDGTVRIAGDYSVTLNRSMKIEHYPVPLLEDVFSTLRGGQYFSKIDLSDAYHQIELDEESKPLTTINTHLGLYQFTRLPFGISSAPSIFQAVIDTVVKGLKCTSAFFDDMIVTGATDEEHLQNLDALLTRLEERGFRLKLKKCEFFQKSLKFLGHMVDKAGVHPDPEKLRAIEEAKRPDSKETLRSFIGMVTYYAKFIPNASAIMSPLYKLLRKDVRYNWAVEQQHAFNDIKRLLSCAPVLAHYDETLPLGVTADASSYGLGGVLFHIYADGSERPIWYASRTLNKAECNYSQVEKEALALVFAVRRFNHYLFGRHFTLFTDHKPLLALLGEFKATSATASARMQRWKLFIANYFYGVEYRASRQMGAADALSRCPLPTTLATDIENDADVAKLVESQVAVFPAGGAQLRRLTERDPTLSRVLVYVRTGWPPQVDRTSPIYSLWQKRDELSAADGVLLWGLRIVIPQKARLAILQELHQGHQGANRMKGLARGYVWWPNIDTDIEEFGKACDVCARTAPDPARTVQHQWDIPERPWYRLHIDFAGPLYGKMWLIVVDALSKYPEVVPLAHATASTTVQALRAIFARFGLPVQLVSDNGAQFTDKQFQDFLHRNGVGHFRVAPHHPASNGEAERFVQTFKRAMSKTKGVDEESLNLTLNEFLLSYRRTPHTTTGLSPSEVLFGRPIRTKFDLLRPDLYERLNAKRPPERVATAFREGEWVWVRNYSGPEKWKAGEIVRELGSATFEVQVGSQLYHRHENQLRSRILLPTELSAEEENERVDRAWEASTQPVHSGVTHAASANRPDIAFRDAQERESGNSSGRSPARAGSPTNSAEELRSEQPLRSAGADQKSMRSNVERQPDENPPVAARDGGSVAPRRSSRVKKPVQRFGDFVYGSKPPR